MIRMAYNAPVIFLICYDKSLSWKNTPETYCKYYEGGKVDASIVTTMMMEATDLGPGTLWVKGYNTHTLTEAFKLPNNIKLVSLLLLGYPDESVTLKPASRKPLEDMVRQL